MSIISLKERSKLIIAFRIIEFGNFLEIKDFLSEFYNGSFCLLIYLRETLKNTNDIVNRVKEDKILLTTDSSEHEIKFGNVIVIEDNKINIFDTIHDMNEKYVEIKKNNT